MSTITSPAFSEVVVFYMDYDFSAVRFGPWRFTQHLYTNITPAKIAREASWHAQLFAVFREMYAVRGFQLVLCAEVWDRLGEYAKSALKEAIAVEKAAGGLVGFSPKPLVVCRPRGSIEGC